MRTYVYSKVKMRHFVEVVTIHRIKRNVPVFVEVVQWDTQAYQGDKSEIQQILIKKGLEPKELGEYYDEFNPKCQFRLYEI